MLEKEKIEIAEQVKGKWTSEREAAGHGEYSGNPCEGCPVGGGCIYTACKSSTHAAG